MSTADLLTLSITYSLMSTGPSSLVSDTPFVP